MKKVRSDVKTAHSVFSGKIDQKNKVVSGETELPQSALPTGRRLLNLAAMKHKGFSIPWLNRRRCDGLGGPPFYKLDPTKKNSPVLYDEAEVDKWLASRHFANTAQAGQFTG